jgi:hypothetical protein
MAFKSGNPGCECCLGTFCITVVDCNGADVPGATLTFVQGSTTVATCTTDGSGQCCVTVPSGVGTIITATHGGLTTVSGSLSVGDGATSFSTMTLGQSLCIAVRGCDVSIAPHRPLAGVDVEFSNGSFSATVTTDSSGNACACVPTSGTTTVHIPSVPTGFNVPADRTYPGGSTTFQLTLASGYGCICACALPSTSTITLTDPVYGGATLTYDATNDWFSGSLSITSCVPPNPSATLYFTYSVGGSIAGNDCVLDISATGYGSADQGSVLTSGNCPPGFAATGSHTRAGAGSLYQCPGGLPTDILSWTITE